MGQPGRALLLLTQPTVVVLALVFVLMQWRIPTVVQMTLTIDMSQTDDVEAMITSMEAGEFSSSTVKKLEIHYPDFPKIRPVTMIRVQNIELKVAGEFHVKELLHNAAQQERQFQVSGLVEALRITTDRRRQDLRMTRFNVLLHSQRAMMGILVIWLIFTAIGWFKIYLELKH